MTENELLTSVALAGGSPVLTRRIQQALATLPPDQQPLAIAFLAWVMGHGEPPKLVRAKAPTD